MPSLPTMLYALASVFLVSAVSLVGVALFFVREAAMRRLLLLFVSFSSGALLGDVFIHLIPEIAEEAESLSASLLVVLGGVVFSFFVEKVIHWRHCHLLPADDHACGHAHHVGVMSLFGDSVHNFIDGLAIGASFLVSVPIGITTTIAIVFHEIPDEIGNFAVLLHAGYSRARALALNLVTALTAVLGTILALVAGSASMPLSTVLLPFAAGNLLYIAGSDLIPELHKETGIRSALSQLLCMVLGIAVMYAMLAFE